ncbi:hypothetical protein PLANTIT3_61169 [Plantibacter sp. T3]|nr:hypothetical protein PLANTIT3_61169 [Plantibacter sp. T3]
MRAARKRTGPGLLALPHAHPPAPRLLRRSRHLPVPPALAGRRGRLVDRRPHGRRRPSRPAPGSGPPPRRRESPLGAGRPPPRREPARRGRDAPARPARRAARRRHRRDRRAAVQLLDPVVAQSMDRPHPRAWCHVRGHGSAHRPAGRHRHQPRDRLRRGQPHRGLGSRGAGAADAVRRSARHGRPRHHDESDPRRP